VHHTALKMHSSLRPRQLSVLDRALPRAASH
jgi:hypothetical protein